MVKIIEVKQTMADTDIVQDMYDIELLIRYIIRQTEKNIELNYRDYSYTNSTLKEIRRTLQKVKEVMAI